jgi:hypothetical protein
MIVVAETIVWIAEVRGQIAEVKPLASITGGGSNGSYLCNLTSEICNAFQCPASSLTNFS